jgi:hypothetical protein
MSRNLILEPILRYKGGDLFDAGMTFHFKF